MIEFIQPYFDAREREVFATRRLPDGISADALFERLRGHFPHGRIALAAKGETAIREIMVDVCAGRSERPNVAIPAVLCGSVLRAVQDHASVRLMDAGESWNAIVDETARWSDILLFAGLGGRRMPVPERTTPDQVLIDDACQCFDGVSGMRPQSDYGVFSFGAGKQMFAGGGAVIYSAQRDLGGLHRRLAGGVADWQLYLMVSQLEKLGEINARRRANALHLIELLKHADWLRLPDPSDNLFLKFTMFIDRGAPAILEPKRLQDHFDFTEHMRRAGVEVEDTYVPLHVRFPELASDARYRDFRCNRLWPEAITLPCRPQLGRAQIERIAQAVLTFRKKTIVAFPDANRTIYESRYTAAMLQRPAAGDYFGKLFDLKLDLVRRAAAGRRVLDLGCGSGALLLPLLGEGFDVTGLDFSRPLLEATAREWIAGGGAPERLRLVHADARSTGLEPASFDLVYSFATLYHVPDWHLALGEITRLLRPGGRALIELGNARSLNDLEAARVATEVRSQHCRPSVMRRAIREAGLAIVEHYGFQALPLYGGETVRSQAVNAALRDAFATLPDGVLAEARVAESAPIAPFAFRRLFVLEKRIPGRAAQDTVRLVRPPSAESCDRAVELRAEAFVLLDAGRLADAVRLLALAWAENPADVDTARAVASLLDGPGERRFVARAERLLARTARRGRGKSAPAAVAPARAPAFREPELDGMQTKARLAFIHRCVTEHAAPRSLRALEIGCYKGSSTVVLAQACRARGIETLHSMDLFTGTPEWGQTFDTFADAQRRIDAFGLAQSVTLVRGDSRTAPWSAPIDVLHIDGDHCYEGVASDIRRFVPHLVDGGIVIFDDYDSHHPGVVRAVDEALAANGELELVEVHRDGEESFGGSLCARRRIRAAVAARETPPAPRASVILPTYNQAAYLPAAIASVLAQTYADFELVIVNDGSTDGTRAYLDSLTDPRVRVIHQENARLPRALNRGFAAARGELWTWTSSDNLCEPMFLESLIAALDAQPRAVLAVSAFAWIDGHGNLLRVTQDQDLSRRGFLARNPGVASFLYRREAAVLAGEYDPGLEGAEDWDFWQRLVAIGPAVYVPEVLYSYREHAQSMTQQIPAKVARASAQTFELAVSRLPGGLALESFYPALRFCADRRTASLDAAFDFAALLLASPFVHAKWALPFCEKVVESAPDSPVALANLAIAQARCASWERLTATLAALAPFEQREIRALTGACRSACDARDPQRAAALAPFRSNVRTAEVFEREERLRHSHLATPAFRLAPAAVRSPLGVGADAPSVSFVIITAGKRPQSLATTIASIRAQEIGRHEILVAGYPPADPGIVAVHAEDAADHGRLGQMRNEAVARARHDLVCLLDDDVILAPGWYAALCARPHAFDVLTADVRVPDGGRYWGHATFGGPRGHVLLDATESDAHVYMSGGCGWVMTRAVARDVHWCSVRGFYAGEDVDFSTRIRAKGYAIEHEPRMLVFHDDPTYTQIGRQVHRRTTKLDSSWVERELRHATVHEIIALATVESRAERGAECADALRYGLARHPDSVDLRRVWTRLESDAGRIAPGRWFAGGDPEYRRVVELYRPQTVEAGELVTA
jgi:glycosyltransferase involved in cell wall biosynthesis/SAM-dependent methyltransferase